MTIKSQPENTSLYHPDKFKMVIQKLPLVTYFLQSAQIPGVTVVESDFQTRFANGYQPGDTMLFDELTVEFLVDEDLSNWKSIYDWMKQIGMPEEPLPEELSERDLVCDIDLHLYNNNNNLNKIIRFKCAFPTNLGTIELNSAATEAQEVIVPITFRYTSFDCVKDDYVCVP